MKLILLYGPPAVGKLTVAKELSKLTGITLFDNHAILNILNDIFGYESLVRRKLTHEFRLRIIEEAVKSKKDLIITGSIMRDNKNLYEGIFDLAEKNKSHLFLVQLKTDVDVLKSRVHDASRDNKINDSSKLDAFLKNYPECMEKFGESDQLVIDTSEISPIQAAGEIVSNYNLL